MLIEAFGPGHHTSSETSFPEISLSSDTSDCDTDGCHLGHCSHVVFSEVFLRFISEVKEPNSVPTSRYEYLNSEPLFRPPIA